MPTGTSFITGAGSGIGRAIALEWASTGGNVIGSYWGEPDDRDAFAEDLRQAGGRSLLRDVDVRSLAEISLLAQEGREAFGAVDLWVNCAARLLVRPFDTTTEEEWLDIMNTNLLGYVRGCRVAMDVLRDGGSIVNVSSVNAVFPSAGLTAYATAKGGVEALTRALAIELGPGIRVNAVSPGAIETPLNQASWSEDVRTYYIDHAALSRTGGAAEIAKTVIAVGSDQLSFVTGQTIVADGGLTINGSAGHHAG